MLVVYFILVGLLLVLGEATSAMHCTTDALPPDCHYILIAWLACRLEPLPSLIILAPLSCAMDAVSGTSFFGMYALFCYSSYALLLLMVKKLPMPESVYRIPLTAISYLFCSWVLYALLVFLPADIEVAAWSWPTMLIRTAIVLLLTWPFFFLFDLLRKFASRNPLPFRKLRLRTDNRRRTHSES